MTISRSLLPAFVAVCLLPVVASAAPSAEAKADKWNNRNSPQAQQAAAQQLMGMLVLDSNDMRLMHLHIRPGLMEVSKLNQEGKYVEAMEAFDRYFTDKLRFPIKYGISAADLDPFQRGIAGNGEWPSIFEPAAKRESIIAGADKLLSDIVFVKDKEVNIGEPGNVNWDILDGDDPEGPAKAPALSLHNAGVFNILINAYLLTHERRYLDKWVDFIDDWCLNDTRLDKIEPCFVSDGESSESTLGTLRILAGIAAAGADEKVVPPRILAMFLKRRLLDYTLLNVVYVRSNTHNWTPSASFFLTALIVDEFKAAPRLMREALRRHIEDNAVTQNLRDGTENQQDPWYNENYLAVFSALKLLDVRHRYPSYADLPWIARLREDIEWYSEVAGHLREHVTYLLHLRDADGMLPYAFSGGSSRTADLPATGLSREAYSEPQNAAIVAAFRNPGSGVAPSFDSEWFPYAGYNIVRGGWKAGDTCGSMFCSPQPGAYGGYRSRSNNNTFCLKDYGQNLLIDDALGHYMCPSSPIKVDGKNQFFHAGIYKALPPAGHKVFEVAAWLEPATWRWHASDKYNLMEGIYAGPWANPGDAPVVNGPYGKDESRVGTMPLDATLRGITHQRLVLYSRLGKLWIVTDRLSSSKKHEYRQVWQIPTAPGPFAAFDPAQIQIDQTQHRISTSAPAKSKDDKGPGKANISMYQFSSSSLKYSNMNKPAEARPDGRILSAGWMEVDAQWEGQGNQQVVTAIVTRAPGAGPEGDLKDVQQIHGGRAAVGFEAVTADGAKVRYLASPEGNDSLTSDRVTVDGEALLVVGNTGIALGCKRMSIGGKMASPGCSDFEFEISGDSLAKVTPINRPISPVQIEPAQNVFIDNIDVTLSSSTPGVEIHYTTDGSDPTPQSAVYTGPFKLTHSAIVNARAYRPGAKTNPVQLSQTEGTVASFGVFDKAIPLEPVSAPKLVLPGLGCRYWQRDWKTLWWNTDTLKPDAVGQANGLWDFSIIPSSNPLVGKAQTPRAKQYAVEYSGYFNAPVDGVYTLHAPREFVWPDIQAGYELRVYLGNHTVPYATRTAVDGLNEWYPSTRLHALGNWSVPLKKGAYPFKVVFIDYRADSASRLNVPGLSDYIWTGIAPDVEISGPGFGKQPIPAGFFTHQPL